jgi:hypothetical protein
MFQALELRHLRVAPGSPHRRVMMAPLTPLPATRIKPALPLRHAPSSHIRRNAQVQTGTVSQAGG